MAGMERWRITPEYTMELADPVTDVVRHIEDEILINLAKHFRGGTPQRSASFDWQTLKLFQLGKVTQQSAEIIARHAGEESGLTRIALERVLTRALRSIEPALSEAAERGLLRGAELPLEAAIQRQVDAYVQQALERQNMVNTAMLNSSLAQYRRMVVNTAAYERQMAQAQKILNRRTGEVVTGVSTHQQAVRKAIRDMLREGLTGFTDRAGRNWTPEAYVNMDVRTTVHNVAVQAVFNRCDEYGLSLIEVDSHPGARPRCAPYQGRIYDRNNGSGYVCDLDGKRIKYEPWGSTSYGEAAGLLGINCGHSIYPFIPGMSRQTNQPVNGEENSEAYQLSQRQRGLERAIRAAKREAACMKAAGDEDGAAEAEAKLRQRQADMRAFCDETGRTRRREREAVVGY